MELRQLEYFVAVAEEANFTKAANKLHVAQPGVSAQIRQLEHELGQPLFDRSGRRVRLTKVGAAVLPQARAALDAIAGARLVVDHLAELMLGRVAVGMVTSCPSLDLPDLLADFHRIHPAIEITLTEANSDALIEELREGLLDMAIIGLGTAPAAGIETQTIADEALVAAVSLEHPLAGRTTITLQALKGRPLISLPPGSGLRASLDEGCAIAGFRPRIAFEASNLNVIVQLARRGLGIAILPESAGQVHAGAIRALTITRPRLRGRLELAWRAESPMSPAARALISHTCQGLASVRRKRVKPTL
jgi:DNA-binding transcriptional LysR family regulator